MPLKRREILAGRLLLVASVLIVAGGLPGMVRNLMGLELWLLVAALGISVPVWIWFWFRAVDSGKPAVRAGSIVYLTAVFAYVSYLAGPGRDALLFAALAAGAAFTLRRAALVVLLIAVLEAALQIALGASYINALATSFNDVAVGAAAIAGRLLLITSQELVRTRDDMAALSAAGERLRVARDLHDVLGQDLTLAILKNELLGAALGADPPPTTRVLHEDLADVLRKALDDLRTAVTGYRQPSLRSELALAQTALRQAGILADVVEMPARLKPEFDAALGSVLREAVTNVLRHSGARHCWITINEADGVVSLEVKDDGMRASNNAFGSGLSGLSERLDSIGGTLATSAESGFRLRAQLPRQ